MEPSPELRDLTKSLYQAMTTGDASFVTTFSRQPGVLCIGTDPAEWWSDYLTMERVMMAQLREMSAGGVRVVAGNPQAYQEGSVGWAADQPTIQMPDGTKMPARITLVAHREGDAWKIVQAHISVGARNEEVLGQTLTVE
jgi:SnoaL-like domain